MNREDIIRLAEEAGLEPRLWNHTDAFERFAALVAAHERNKIAAWMIDRGYATGHGDTTEDLLKELEWQIKERERHRICEMLRDRQAKEERHNYYLFIANIIKESA